MLNATTAKVLRDAIELERREAEALDLAIEERLASATNLDRRRSAALERMSALQADLAVLVPSPATLAAKAAR